MKTIRGFIGIELGIALAIIAILGVTAVAGYSTYHARMEAGTSTSSTGSWWPSPSTSTPPATNGGGSTTGGADNSGSSTGGTVTGSATVTSADNGSTYHLHEGDHLILALSNTLHWDISFSNESVMKPLLIPLVPQDQGAWEASAKGTTTLTATGHPICDTNGPCPQFLEYFKIAIVVD